VKPRNFKKFTLIYAVESIYVAKNAIILGFVGVVPVVTSIGKMALSTPQILKPVYTGLSVSPISFSIA
jgi:hypothetical protein